MLPAVLLAFAVVFTGNHFVLDVVAGFVVVAAGLVVAARLHARSLLGSTSGKVPITPLRPQEAPTPDAPAPVPMAVAPSASA